MVSHPHEARIEICMLDVVAMVMRRTKTEGSSRRKEELGNSRKETFWSLSL